MKLFCVGMTGDKNMGRRRHSINCFMLVGITVSVAATLYVVQHIHGDQDTAFNTSQEGKQGVVLVPNTPVVHRVRTLVSENVLYNRDLCPDYKKNYLLKSILPDWKDRLKNSQPDDEPNAFGIRLNESEHAQLVEVFAVFKDICDTNDIEFMVYGDSLLGAYRHFGIIPWGDRLHIMTSTKSANKLIYVLNALSGYECTTFNGVDWIFSKKNTSSKFELNIKFYQENNEYIWDFDEFGYPISFIQRADVFPLACSPFETFLVRVPRRMKKVLESVIVTDKCIGRSPGVKHDPDLERIEMVPCVNLYPYYPFVFESKKNNTMVRQLKIDKGLISIYIIHNYDKQ